MCLTTARLCHIAVCSVCQNIVVDWPSAIYDLPLAFSPSRTTSVAGITDCQSQVKDTTLAESERRLYLAEVLWAESTVVCGGRSHTRLNDEPVAGRRHGTHRLQHCRWVVAILRTRRAAAVTEGLPPLMSQHVAAEGARQGVARGWSYLNASNTLEGCEIGDHLGNAGADSSARQHVADEDAVAV